LAIELLSFRPGKEATFEEDVLHFASRRYQCDITKTWTATVVHVTDPRRWIDLFDVSRHTCMEASPSEWPSSDAWSFAWDVLTPAGWSHAAPAMRPELATRMELTSFDPEVASKAVKYDLVTFLQDPLLTLAANRIRMADYCVQVLIHEALHFVSDWCHRQIVVDAVHPYRDRQVIKTLAAFIRDVGGWNAFKQRYLV